MRFHSFIVDAKDLFDRKKNPTLCLSAEGILKNKRIKKIFLDDKEKVIKIQEVKTTMPKRKEETEETEEEEEE